MPAGPALMHGKGILRILNPAGAEIGSPAGAAAGSLAGADVSTPAGNCVDVVLLPALAAEALRALGDASPLARAEILYFPPEPALEDATLAPRRALLSSAERKLAAGHALVSTGMGGEALCLLRAAMGLACRALDDQSDPGDDPAAQNGRI